MLLHVYVTATTSYPVLGYSCSDLGSVCKEAAMAPIKELMASGWSGEEELMVASGGCTMQQVEGGWGRSVRLRKLCLRDFSAAIEMIRPSAVDQADYAAA